MAKKSVFANLSDEQIMKHLSEGDTVKGIAITYGINKRTMEDKIERIRQANECNCIPQLITKFLTKQTV